MRVLLALAVVLTASGCAGSAGLGAPAETPQAAPQAQTPAAEGRLSVAELEALYRARQQADRDRYNAADAAFMAGMIHHHAQALVMAEMARTHGAGPELRRLAARIDNAQHDEIATMQRWLADRGQPVPAVADDGTTAMSPMDHGAMDHGAMDHGDGMAGMPGMLTAGQLAELDAARGTAFDRLFLRFMIQHHTGAVIMVDELFASDGAAQNANTFKLASDIQVDQRTEIARMQLMLDALPEAP